MTTNATCHAIFLVRYEITVNHFAVNVGDTGQEYGFLVFPDLVECGDDI